MSLLGITGFSCGLHPQDAHFREALLFDENVIYVTLLSYLPCPGGYDLRPIPRRPHARRLRVRRPGGGYRTEHGGGAVTFSPDGSLLVTGSGTMLAIWVARPFGTAPQTGHPGQPRQRILDLSLVSVAIATETKDKSRARMRKPGIPGIRPG